MAILSPVTGKPNIRLIQKIDIATLQGNYGKEQIDVRKHFNTKEELSLYEYKDSISFLCVCLQ